MKKQIKYIATLLSTTLLLAACSKESETINLGEKGVLKINIADTRAEGDGTYNPMDKLLVRIYNDKGLIRRYKAQSEIPSSLELLAGSYTVKVEAGDKADASFEKRFYVGEQPFDITAGTTTPVEVKCKMQNVAAQVKFDATVATTFGSQFHAWVVAADAYNADDATAGTVPALQYTADATGYFTLPEGVTTLAWHFEGTPAAGGAAIVKEGVMTNIAGGNRYQMTFKYSKDLPGFIELFIVKVDTSTDDFDDTIIFSPDPTIEGSGFDITEAQDYIAGTTGDKVYKIGTMAAIKGISMAIDNATRVDLLTAAPAGVTVEKTDNYNVTVTLSAAAFAGLSGGEHNVSFRVTDADGADVIKNSPYRMQGLLPVESGDYDLWTNTVTLKALVLDTTVGSVDFGLRVTDGEWQTATGVAAGNNIYTASFTAAWTESTNEKKLTIYTPNPTTGVFAGRSYEGRAIMGSATSTASFATDGKQVIPDGDMESGSLPCFSSNSTSSPFWASGNAATGGLCSQGTKTGMGGSHCAYLKAQKTFGMLAAGNLFSATFVFASLKGTVSFGVPYDWQARPTAIRLKMHATVGKVDYGSIGTHEYIQDGQDRSRIYAVITDWSSRHETSSGMGDPAGVWDPVATTSTAEGNIIGYGSLLIKDSTPGDEMVTVDIPIQYYDKTTRPSKAYSLVISCATSAYGDYKVGCLANAMYVDDFEWIY